MATLVERTTTIIDKIDKLDDRTCKIEGSFNEFRTGYERRHAELVGRVIVTEKQSEEHDQVLKILRAEVKTLISVVEGLQHTTRAVVWLGGLVGGAIVLYLVTAILQVI